MYDASMWTQTEAMDDVLHPPPPRSTYASTSSSKRRDDVDACAHCGRLVSALIFNDACTYECALALAMSFSYRYDYVFVTIMSQQKRADVPMPLPAPKLYYDTITAERYWERAAEELYSKQPVMAEYLQERLQSNAVTNVIGEKKRRSH